MRAPTPPLPPDPSPRTATPTQANQQSQRVGSQPPSPVSAFREQPQPGLKRVDSSRTPQRQQPGQLMKDALTDALEHSPVTNQLNNLNQLDPEFIKQVTEQVIKTLQATSTTPAASAPPQQAQYPPPPPPQQSQEPRSPTRSSTDSGGAGFTPPTPERIPEAREIGVTSPSPSPSDAGSHTSARSSHSIRSNESQRSGNTPKPFSPESTTRLPRANYSTRRRSGTIPTEDKISREAAGYDNTATDRTPYRRNSKETGYDGASRSEAQQSPPPPDNGETPLEKFWQPLFDNGTGTPRLSQFLRGLALHLIDDYEPKGSLVVTPAKMLRFLRETRVEQEQEHYPWEVIFGGNLTPVSISSMYQKLLCQHHLVQDQPYRAPTVPGLTPHGFDVFMTCLIQAHPDTEFERLAKAVMNMPISNADNKTERFPKTLSRRLLPNFANIQAEQRLVSSLDHEHSVFSTLRGTSQMPPPPSQPPPNQGNSERDPKRSSRSSQQSNAVDDDDLVSPPSMPIERERKPYFAKEGTGKQYHDGRPNPTPYRPAEGLQGNSSRVSRANSGVPPQAMYASSSGPSEPVNIPPRQSHRLSTSQVPSAANGGYSRSGRRSSPPMRNPFARSEPDFVGSIPNSQYGTNLHPTQSREQYTSVDADEEQKQRYRSRSRAERPGTLGSNSTDEDRGYPIPSRGVPIGNGGYEYGTGPAPGGPPVGSDHRGQPAGGMHPVGSFPARRPGIGTNTGDGRRKSMHVPGMGMGGDGGTDGYGSFAGSMNGGPNYPPPQQPYGTSSQY